jgi:3-oxoacyl-[acyl-carrier-protein] synthase II
LERRRVVITGIGLVTPLGTGTEITWKNILECKSGGCKITQFDCTGWPVQIAAEVKDFNAEDWMDRRDVRRFARFIHFAQAGSSMALKDSKLTGNNFDHERAGVLIGSGIGGLEKIEEQKEKLMEGGYKKMSPFFIPSEIINMASGYVSMQFNLKGPNSAVCTACSTGNHAIGDAFNIIRRGEADIMVSGGSEACITQMAVGGFQAMHATSRRNDDPETASRPFDISRDGFLMGEGTGILILEELEHAKKRGVDIYAEIIGYGMTSDAFHYTAPDETGNGPARVMKAALKDADLKPSDISYINAHGTATPVGDPIEVKAVKTVFGEDAYKIPVSSTKSMTGHLLGAAGGLESALSILALKYQVIPPTINLENPDPNCDLDFVPNKPREAQLENILSNSFGFGGTNSCLIFKKYTA